MSWKCIIIRRLDKKPIASSTGVDSILLTILPETLPLSFRHIMIGGRSGVKALSRKHRLCCNTCIGIYIHVIKDYMHALVTQITGFISAGKNNSDISLYVNESKQRIMIHTVIWISLGGTAVFGQVIPPMRFTLMVLTLLLANTGHPAHRIRGHSRDTRPPSDAMRGSKRY